MSRPAQNRRCRARLAVFVAALALFGGGCTSLEQWVCNGFKVGPNYHQPPAPVEPDWIDADDPRVVAAPPEDAWWAVFNDPALNSLIETAYRQNLDLKTAATRILQAQAQRNIAAGNLLPQTQNALGAYSHAQLSKSGGLFGLAAAPATSGAAAPGALDVWATGINASWELDFWGRIRRNIESSNAELGASVEDYHSAVVSLLADAATTYVQIRTFQQRIELARKNVELQKGSLRYAEDRLKAGAATKLDVEQGRSTVLQTEATIPPLEIGLREATDRLCVLLGTPPKSLASCLPDGAIPTAPPDVAVGLPADLLMRRPDVRSAERAAASQSAQIGVAEADFYPRIGVTGFIGYTADDIRQLFTENSYTGLILPNFQWKILNYGRILNNVRSQEAGFQGRLSQYQQTVLNAGREVEDGLVQFLRYQVQAHELEQSVQAAQNTVGLVREQLDLGRVDYNRLYTVESQLVTQQDQLAVAQGNIALSLIAVYRALGGGWQVFDKGSPAGPCPEPTACSDHVDSTPADDAAVPANQVWVPAMPGAPELQILQKPR